MSDQWVVHSEEILHATPWVGLHVADVETPSGARLAHHLIRVPDSGAGTVIVDESGNVLLIYRYRFIPDRFGWELPAGRVDPREDPKDAARREALEETGWEPQELTHLFSMNTSPGLTDQVSHAFLGRRAVHRGKPTDTDESIAMRWCTPSEIRELIQNGEIADAFTLSGLLWHIAFTS
jgi:8-oxo-dGTP pyrophosphatase MutT (NUDIX family)